MDSKAHVVFVYLGGLLPKYAVNNLRIFRKRFPSLNVVLISDFPENKRNAIDIDFYSFDSSVPLFQFANSKLNDVSFRDGFWVHTLTRFHALSSYMKTQPFVRVIHFEFDVWVSDDFPFGLFDKLENEIAYSIPSSTEGSAAVLSLKDQLAGDKLTQLIEKIGHTSEVLTDMSILRAIYDKELMSIDILPISPEDPDLGQSNFEDFIFDPSSWGMYLLGQDPRNFRGIQVFRRKEDHHYIDPRRYSVNMSAQSIFVKHNGRQFRLANLHVHSKDLRFFSNLEKSRKHLKKYLNLYKEPQGKEFRIPVFLSLLWLKFRKEIRQILQVG